MRYVALNTTKSATIDEDVKITYVVRILNHSLFYFLLCLIVFMLYYASFICTLYYGLFISTLYYVSFICTFSCAGPFLTFCRMEHQYPLLEEEYEKDYRASYIEYGQVT
jgi:hypothetical protein